MRAHGTLSPTALVPLCSEADVVMPKSRQAPGFALALLLGGSLFLPSAAWAYLNAVELSRKEAVKLINDAETALAAGEAAKALALLNRKLDSEEGYEVSSPQLDKRIQRVWAVARLRAGDSADVDAAVNVLREQSRENKKDPGCRCAWPRR